jgi:cell shape-determining protein MreC
MRRTFLAKRNTLLSGNPISWGAWALLFALVLVLMRIVVPGLFWSLTAPAFSVSGKISESAHVFFGRFQNAELLSKRNDELTSVNAALAAENKTLSQKIADLDALGGATAAEEEEAIPAAVLTRPPTSPYDTLLVAAGAREGAMLHMEAFGAGGVPVGFVSAVSSHVSRVTLFSAPGIETDAWLGDAATGIRLSGKGGGPFIASIARTIPAAVGDIVSISGPGRIAVGSVAQIDADPLSPTVRLDILPLINPFSIAWVSLRATGAENFLEATSTPL